MSLNNIVQLLKNTGMGDENIDGIGKFGVQNK